MSSLLDLSAGPCCTPTALLGARSFKLKGRAKHDINGEILASSILVIDGTEAHALHVKQILASAGFKNVHSETQPRNVVARIRELKPDLIALDLQMPDISGMEIMGLLASDEESLHDGPLLVLSADTSVNAKRNAFDLGADFFLPRPVDVTDLCLRVSNLLARNIDRKQLEAQNLHLQEMVEARAAELEQTNKSLEVEMRVRKKADTLLRDAERRLRFLLTSSPTSIFSANPNPPYNVTFISDNVQSQLGYAAKEFTADPDFRTDHLHPDDATRLAVEMPLLVVKGHYTTECRFMHKDGLYRWMQSDMAVILDATGAPSEVIGSWMDISDRKLSEEILAKQAVELSSVNARLQEYGRLKSEFVSTASHEMRTPLTVIREFANLLADGAAGSTVEEQSECYEAILRNCDRLTAMLDYLLDFRRIEAGKLTLRRERVSATEVIRRCYKDMLPKCARHGLTFKLEVPDELPLVLADEEQLMQVLVNLAGNAMKFTPEGGSVELSAIPGDGYVQISVTDTGRGIAPENLDSVFEAFRQIDRVEGPGFRGTGLGLTISKSIVEMHDGNLSVESTVGSGTKFSFTLPLWSESAGLEALVDDKWEDSEGAVFLLVVRPKTDGSSPGVLSVESLAPLAIATKAALRAYDNGMVLPDYGCIAYVLECNRAGITAAVERLSKESAPQVTGWSDISYNVVEITERHGVSESLLKSLEGMYNANIDPVSSIESGN